MGTCELVHSFKDEGDDLQRRGRTFKDVLPLRIKPGAPPLQHGACRASLRLPKEIKYETRVFRLSWTPDAASGFEKSDLGNFFLLSSKHALSDR